MYLVQYLSYFSFLGSDFTREILGKFFDLIMFLITKLFYRKTAHYFKILPKDASFILL